MKKILNLIDFDKSEIKYKIHHFPDGEKHFELLEDISIVNVIDIKCRIKSPNDIFIIHQILDVLYYNQKYLNTNLHLYYLTSMRMDRRMSDNRSFSLKIIIDLLGDLIIQKLCIDSQIKVLLYEPHSDVSKKLLDDYCVVQDILLPWKLQYPIANNAIICFPDEGAKKRYSNLFPNNPIIYGEKVRDYTGVITSYELKSNLLEADIKSSDLEIVVIDDLCDGGGTFIKLAKKLDKVYPNSKRTLCITHMIQKSAIDKLSECYDTLIITNSFLDWNKEKSFGISSPNVHIIDIINK